MRRLRFSYLFAVTVSVAGSVACGGSKSADPPSDGGLTHDAGKDGGHPKADAGSKVDSGHPPTDSGNPPPGDDGSAGDDGGTPTDDAGDDGAIPPTDDAGDDAGLLDAGTIVPPPPPTGPGSFSCQTPMYLAVPSANLDLWASMDGGTDVIPPPCAADAGITSEVFYEFAFSAPVFVYADTFGSTWNTVLFLLSPSCVPITASTTTGDAVCNDNACGTEQSQIVALVEPGNYILGVAVIGDAPGTATIHFQYAIAASGNETPLPKGSTVQTGDTVGNTGNIQDIGSCIAAGPENGYWWTSCPSDPGGNLTASTCGGTTWESVIETQIPQFTPPYACTVDGCYPGTSLALTVPPGAGLRVLCIDGETGGAGGSYTMNVTRP